MASVQVQLPHNFDEIIKGANSQIDKSSDKLIEQLHRGILLNQKTLMFSVDKESGSNTFEIYARGLSIASGHDQNCWKWRYMTDTEDHPVQVEVAELLQVSKLDVRTKFATQYLTPKSCYEVSFVLQKLKNCDGFKNHPVNLKLAIPNRKPIERTEDLSEMPEDKWKEIKVGVFNSGQSSCGEMEISMYEHKKQLKKGIVVNKIKIRCCN